MNNLVAEGREPEYRTQISSCSRSWTIYTNSPTQLQWEHIYYHTILCSLINLVLGHTAKYCMQKNNLKELHLIYRLELVAFGKQRPCYFSGMDYSDMITYNDARSELFLWRKICLWNVNAVIKELYLFLEPTDTPVFCMCTCVCLVFVYFSLLY